MKVKLFHETLMALYNDPFYLRFNDFFSSRGGLKDGMRFLQNANFTRETLEMGVPKSKVEQTNARDSTNRHRK